MNRPTNPSRRIVAAEVRAAMGRADITQAALADQMSISRAALSDRLAARRPFSTEDLFEIGTALGIDPTSLMVAPARPAEVSA